MEYLLDTNICIYLIKKKPVHVYEKFKNSVLGSIGISSITLAELHYGIQKSSKPEKNREALNKFLLPLEIIDFDIEAAKEFGQVRAELERSGNPIGPYDTLIAGHARALGLTVVTNNEKEFLRVDGLKVENWTK